jgi:hypothetical protein
MKESELTTVNPGVSVDGKGYDFYAIDFCIFGLDSDTALCLALIVLDESEMDFI